MSNKPRLDKYTDGLHRQVKIHLRFGEWEYRYFIRGARGGVEFWCRTTPRYGEKKDLPPKWYGGVEGHKIEPWRGEDRPFDHKDCEVTGGKCWHDGSSMAADRFLTVFNGVDHGLIFSMLLGVYRDWIQPAPEENADD